MLALGAVISTRIRGFKDYFLAGGSLTTPLLVCTLVSSYYGIDVTFGTSESSYYYGMVAWFWYSLPFYVFFALAALVIAPRLRRYGDAMTMSDVIEQHYGRGTRVVGAAACFIYSAPVLAMAGMMTLMDYLGLPVGWGLVVTIGVCAIYTTMGGLMGRCAQRHGSIRADVRVAGDCDSAGRQLGRRLGLRRASAASIPTAASRFTCAITAGSARGCSSLGRSRA